MEFSPANDTVRLCLRGMSLEEEGNHDEAGRVFIAAWNGARSDFERFIASYHVARTQASAPEKLRWFEKSLDIAKLINDDAVRPSFSFLHTKIAKCYEEMNDFVNAKRNHELADSLTAAPSDSGPFYHGTRADLAPGDLLTPGHGSNYKPDLTMNHIYFTALMNGAGLAAALAKGDGSERVYIVEPTGTFENDPNVTNNKFPGNPTRSYRTDAPLRIVGEATKWRRQTPEELQKWRARLATNKGEIIN